MASLFPSPPLVWSKVCYKIGYNGVVTELQQTTLESTCLPEYCIGFCVHPHSCVFVFRISHFAFLMSAVRYRYMLVHTHARTHTFKHISQCCVSSLPSVLSFKLLIHCFLREEQGRRTQRRILRAAIIFWILMISSVDLRFACRFFFCDLDQHKLLPPKMLSDNTNFCSFACPCSGCFSLHG